MKINTTQVLVGYDGTPMKDNVNGELVDATVRQSIVTAVSSPVEKDSLMKKVEKDCLAMKVFQNDEVDLNEAEIIIIKERVGELYAPRVVGQIVTLLTV